MVALATRPWQRRLTARPDIRIIVLVVTGLMTGCASQRAASPSAPPGTVLIEAPVVSRSASTAETADDYISPPPRGSEPPAPGVLDSVGDIVDRAQRGATERFGAFMFELDDFFSGDHVSDEPNTSFLRVRADAVRSPLDGFELDPAVKLRLVLPRAERRFRLLLSSGEDESGSSDELERVAGTEENDSVAFALRFARQLRNSVKLDFDIGARQREGDLQVFARFNAQYRKDLSDLWALRLSNRYFLYSRSGYDDRVRIDVTRQLGALDDARSSFFRSSTTVDWRASRRGARIGQTLGIYLDLDAKSALAIEGIASYDTKLNDEATERLRGGELRLRYRRNLWRPWLYVELWPAVAWPAEREYRRTWNGLARVEVTIGGEQLIALQEASGDNQ